MKLVITMSRRFGTGASIIATELSKRLDIPVYDKAYIEEQLNDRMYESEAEASGSSPSIRASFSAAVLPIF